MSGEHAVVFGRPALAMAIDRSAQSVITSSPGESVEFNLVDFQSTDSFTVRALRDMRDRVLRNYRFFLEGKLGIRDVLYKPVELFEYMFINFLDGLHLKLNESISIQTRSDIPIGCGLGSSAATVLSAARAVGHYFRVDFRPDWYYRYSMEAEKMQHGYPSGVDSYIAVNGGCALFRDGQAAPVPLPRFNLYLVNTGTPETTTGECVVEVKKRHEKSAIWGEFEGVTLGLEEAIRKNDMEAIRRCVRENNELLVRIGVVPEKVHGFIRAVEMAGGAAKVCGAGAIRGDAGGMVLVIDDQPPSRLCQEYGYTITSVRGDPLGARIID
ncbi:MAG TPA: mevalonate kinase [Kiritimatiellia bacterium]|nr:mevalonate kinase [Kiritimatiellia bacterium]HMO99158.1 mevalonate kinase [Kiritimatiellia bacterium]HMP95664.1 mevalonate kinase [Kiritimatiellia bacterium]